MTSALPEPGRPLDGRTPEQVAIEDAAQRVSGVLTNLEGTLAYARKALKAVEKDGVDVNAAHALRALIPELDRLRKRLQQDTYFAGDNLRLM